MHVAQGSRTRSKCWHSRTPSTPSTARSGVRRPIKETRSSGGTAPRWGQPGEVPPPPLNLVGDFGGGGMFLAFGVVCALYEARHSGQGQVIDAAVVDGTALLSTTFHAMVARGLWSQQRASNLLDGGAPFYGTYACADGTYVSVRAIEPKFHGQLLERLGLRDDPDFQDGQFDKQR
ncbi:CoA transferase [Streptomyces flaveolus]|uniref:CoA transferase n=1 Tax=Streptomyces flaveolus TaxID=67297 RepID=UPI0033DE88E8